MLEYDPLLDDSEVLEYDPLFEGTLEYDSLWLERLEYEPVGSDPWFDLNGMDVLDFVAKFRSFWFI